MHFICMLDFFIQLLFPSYAYSSLFETLLPISEILFRVLFLISWHPFIHLYAICCAQNSQNMLYNIDLLESIGPFLLHLIHYLDMTLFSCLFGLFISYTFHHLEKRTKKTPITLLGVESYNMSFPSVRLSHLS